QVPLAGGRPATTSLSRPGIIGDGAQFPGPAPRAPAAGRYPRGFPVVFLRPDALAVLCWLWAARGTRPRRVPVVPPPVAGSGAVPGDRTGTEAIRRAASYSSTTCRGILPLGEASSPLSIAHERIRLDCSRSARVRVRCCGRGRARAGA